MKNIHKKKIYPLELGVKLQNLIHAWMTLTIIN